MLPASQRLGAAIRRRLSQASCQQRNLQYFKYLNEKPRSNDRGTIADQGNNCRAKPGFWGSAWLRCRRVEHQREAVHAVAQSGRLRTVVEDVTQMAAAAAAMDLGARHAEGPVICGADGVLERLEEARPAGAALELGIGGE